MRVGLVIKEFDATRGGAERYAVNLARQLVRLGHEVHVFCHRAATPAGLPVEVHPVPIASWPASRRFLSFPANARRAYGKSGLDVIHGLTQTWPQDVHRAGGGVHRTWVRLGHPNPVGRFFHQATPRELARRWVESRIYRPGHYAFVMTNSELVRGHVLEEYGADPERVVVVRNGVDHAQFHPGVQVHREAVRASLGIADDEFVALFASSNFPRKGLATLIEAVARVGCRLVVAGGARRDAFVDIARRRGVAGRVHFVSQVADIERWYGAADCFALPTRYDPFANACLEAMACGLPVVTTRANGASEAIVPGESGHVIEDPDDVAALARALEDFAGPGRAPAMGAAAARTAAGYTLERHAAETCRLYERAMQLRTWDWT